MEPASKAPLIRAWALTIFWSLVWAALGMIIASLINSRFISRPPIGPGGRIPQTVFDIGIIQLEQFGDGVHRLTIDLLIVGYGVGAAQISMLILGTVGGFALSIYSHRPRRRVADSPPKAVEKSDEPSDVPANPPVAEDESGPPSDQAT